MYLLDTCLLSELIKKNPNPQVVAWMVKRDDDDLFLSVLTLGELKKGLAKLPASKSKSELSEWIQDLESRFQHRIIPIDLKVAEHWGKVQVRLEKAGQGMPTVDGLIACTAISRGMIVVTRNGKDMERSGVEIFNPWEEASQE